MKKKAAWIWFALWGAICLVGGGGTLFSWMPRTPAMFYGGCAMLVISVALGTALVRMARGKKAWPAGVIAGGVYAALLAVIVILCDEVIFKDCIADYQPVHSSLIVVVLNLALMLAALVLIPKKYDPKLVWLKRIVALVLVATAFALSGMPQNWWWSVYKTKILQNHRVADPVGFSTWTKPDFGVVEDADFYVAVDGDDNGDGSFAHPFATIEKARDAVRTLDKTGRSGITVAVKAGEYLLSNLTFTEADSGTAECPITYCAYGDGEVILNAGVSLDPADFAKVTDSAILSRLQERVRDKVVCVDLTTYGLTAEDLGRIYAFGEVSTAKKYDGDYVGPIHCELFVNDQRQTIARYPNTDQWVYTDVLEEGVPHLTNEEWNALDRNPKGDTYTLTQELADRIHGWQDLENVWMWGYLTVDWAFCTNRIENFDYENRTLLTTFCSRYGVRDDAAYYYFNVFEELDTAGEWYLDRETCVLYLYAPEKLETCAIELSVSQEDLLVVEDAEHLTFRGFTLQGTRGNAVNATGNHLTVEYCLIHNVGGYGVILYGYDNLVGNNEVTRTGQGGIELGGGDPATLTPGNSRVYNNLVHDWGQTDGYHGIRLRGVGNLVDHNELYNYRDVAINHYGNNHVIEYNLIHDVSLQSNDASAIYTGTTSKSWEYMGTTVRYNAIYNVGTHGFCYPNGIYADDAIIGQRIYGNLLVNVPDNGILVGGGREHSIWGNVVINTGNCGISYDQRTYEWDFFRTGSQDLWQKLQNAIGDREVWEANYPYLKELHFDGNNMDDPMYVRNPANSQVNGNLFINAKGELGSIADKPAKYSDFSGNAVYELDMLKKIFVDPENGDYRLKKDSAVYQLIPEFEDLPIAQMGRE